MEGIIHSAYSNMYVRMVKILIFPKYAKKSSRDNPYTSYNALGIVIWLMIIVLLQTL